MNPSVLLVLLRKDLRLFFANRFFALVTGLALVAYVGMYYLLPAGVDETLEIGWVNPGLPARFADELEGEGVILHSYADAAALRAAVAAGGGQLVAVERHAGDMPGMSAAVKRIAAAINRIDALMIAGNDDTLLLAASFVPYHDIDAREKLVLVATVTWDDPRLPREVALYGAYLAAPLTQRREDFQRRFKEAYKREAPRLAALGYDAAALAIAAIREAGDGPLVPVLTTPDGFEGYEGFFRLLPDGGNVRQLPILQLQRGGPRVVDEPGGPAN